MNDGNTVGSVLGVLLGGPVGFAVAAGHTIDSAKSPLSSKPSITMR